MADGHGYAHPRRFGYACHLGLLLDVPAIGVAKSRLIGEAGTVGVRRGSRTDLVDGGEVIGSVLRTRESVRPLYVSVGHRIGLEAAERWVLACATKYRMPEPTRLADGLAGEAKRRMLDATMDIVVEQRAGEHGRWEWEPSDNDVVFRHELDPMPVHYGCSVDIVNPADSELLDVMIVDGRERGRGERMAVRIVDVLLRGDGDHKLLALPLDASPFAASTERRLAAERKRIWSWYVAHEKPVTHWGGEQAAVDVIRSCRDTGAAYKPS
jgi:inorganic pyrophosphatase